MTSSSDPDVIRQQIEDTRANLSYDVDALNEKVNPARVVDRRVTRTKRAVDDLRGRVMGRDSSSGDMAGPVKGAAHDAAHGVAQAPDAVVSQTRGNPMAAGLIAFGVGWLVSSLLPTSEKEKQLAAQAEDAAQPLLESAKESAKQVAQEAGQALQPAAQEAVESVKGTAQEAVQTVKEEGQSAAGDVQGQAQQARDTVQDAR
jgi:gas vesicle protein